MCQNYDNWFVEDKVIATINRLTFAAYPGHKDEKMIFIKFYNLRSYMTSQCTDSDC